MEGYILVADNYILSREIFSVFVLLHCLLGYSSGALHFYVPPKLYHGFFITEFLMLTAFIVWCCVSEPFKDGVGWAVFGWFWGYLVVFLCWFMLKHLMISHTKVYQMVPEYRIKYRGRKGIGGYIIEGGCRHFVAVMDKKRHDELQKGAAPIKVRFNLKSKIGHDGHMAAIMKIVEN